MGTVLPLRQGVRAEGPIAAFDFDGTLTVRDSFMAFLIWEAGPVSAALKLIRLAPSTLAYLGHRDRGRIKAAALRIFLRGAPLARAQAQARAFADQARLLRPDALACWEAWKARGARMTIVSASPQFVVEPFAQRLGADRLIATQVERDAEGRITGALLGRNCRGPEKVARLRQEFGPDVRLEAAYGDTDGDREMLALAKTAGMKVFRQRP
ncbi:MAG TPA: HAD-IB family hydrolase [Caulobacteraceae bacterium]|jgi:phosphatidylglycerophosphatase C|nr:HAD-IB family hydrolase [Caulobacteraceae bacterium]